MQRKGRGSYEEGRELSGVEKEEKEKKKRRRKKTMEKVKLKGCPCCNGNAKVGRDLQILEKELKRRWV